MSSVDEDEMWLTAKIVLLQRVRRSFFIEEIDYECTQGVQLIVDPFVSSRSVENSRYFFFLVKWFDFTIPRINKGRVKDKDLVFPECVSAKDCERSRILFVRIEFTPCKSCEILLDIFMGGKDREKRSLLFIPTDHPTLYFISNF